MNERVWPEETTFKLISDQLLDPRIANLQKTTHIIAVVIDYVVSKLKDVQPQNPMSSMDFD